MVLVKSMVQRKKLGMMPQVPFSVYCRRVSFLLTQLRKSHFPLVNTSSMALGLYAPVIPSRYGQGPRQQSRRDAEHTGARRQNP